MSGKRTVKRWVPEESVKSEEPNKPEVAENLRDLTIKQEVAIRSLFPARLRYAGHITGKAYEWGESGAVVMVNDEDVPYLLSKRIGERGCCGAGGNGNVLFEAI